MRTWEFVLQERFEQDRMRLMDYRAIDLEFKEWLIGLFYEEVKKQDERGKHDSDDDSVHDDRICDRECVRTEQDQDADSGSDHANDEWTQIELRAAEDRLAEMIAAEPAEAYEASDVEDIYESYYEEIAAYQSNLKSRSKKKKHKRKRKE